MKTTRRIIQATSLSALALAALLVASASDTAANHVSGTTTRWSIDADVNGNTPTSLGSLDSCIEAAADTDVVIDITTEGIPAVDAHGTPEETNDDTGGVISFHSEVAYDESALSVVGVDAAQLLNSLPGSSMLTVLEANGLPDTDGLLIFDVADLGVTPDNTESGTGVVARITFHTAPGTPADAYTVALGTSAHIDLQSQSLVPPVAYSAQIAIGMSCPGNLLVGDVDCSTGVNAVDALKILRASASLSVAQTEPCNNVGTQSPPVGDVDCNGATNSVDALKVLRHGSGMGYTKVHYCDDIGA